MFDLTQIVRPNVLKMAAHSSARDEFTGEARMWLDANENPYPSDVNRYPDPRQRALKQKLGAIKGVSPANIFLGNGSDEAIDLLFRAFCEPGKDKVLVFPPTYGMYKVSAALNDVELLTLPLTADFQLNLAEAKAICKAERPKMLFICSPNNPTGNLIPQSQIIALASACEGIVVVDEAYIDFAPEGSMLPQIGQGDIPNLVVMQTFSKAWGMAGIRLGMAFASEAIIQIFDKIKPPYNVNSLTQQVALARLEEVAEVKQKVVEIVAEREKMKIQLAQLKGVKRILPSDANFLLVEWDNPLHVFQSMIEEGIILRDRRSAVPNCLRITIGTPDENEILMQKLIELEQN